MAFSIGRLAVSRSAATGVLAALLLQGFVDDASATPSSNVRQSSAPNADFKARATVVIKEVFGAEYLSDWEKAELTAYVASELERDIENYPQKDRDRVKFAQGEVIKRKFHLPLITGRMRWKNVNSSADVSILPLSDGKVLVRLFAYKLTSNNVTTCDVIARATIDPTGTLLGRSIDYDIDNIAIEGKVGAGGKSLKVQLQAGPDDYYPGCGIGLSLDGTYVSH